jgi:tetratricopeptide (TPR) repeat protein
MIAPSAMRLKDLAAFLAAAGLAAAACAPGALAQARGGGDPVLETARAECESAARANTPSPRALGACDLVLRASGITPADRARALTNRGVIALKRNDVAAARADLEDAVRDDAGLASAWLSLSAARIRAGAYDGAITAAREAEQRGGDPALARFNIAIALERLGRYDDAYDAYVEAARLDPDNRLLAAQPARFVRHRG